MLIRAKSQNMIPQNVKIKAPNHSNDNTEKPQGPEAEGVALKTTESREQDPHSVAMRTTVH